MKLFRKGLTISYVVLVSAPLLSAYRGPGDAEKYVVDRKESVVTWTGSMQFSKNGHTGYAYLSQGELTIEKGQLVGGTVEVDMNTLVDETHGSDNDLIGHLKSADFFDVKKFPVAAFTITRVAP